MVQTGCGSPTFYLSGRRLILSNVITASGLLPAGIAVYTLWFANIHQNEIVRE